jgi:hypothetical protein
MANRPKFDDTPISPEGANIAPQPAPAPAPAPAVVPKVVPKLDDSVTPTPPTPTKTITPQDLPNVNAPAAPSAAFYQHGNKPIIAMQQALINFSRDIASNAIDVTDRTTDKGEFLTGSNPFMNFLVTSYLNKARVSGKQLVDTDLRQPTRMDSAKKNDNFKGVLATINRIGTPGGPGTEQRPDGIWGPRTNNALKQVAGLAHTMLEVKKDMGLGISGYSETDLAQLQSAIPDDINSLKNINEKVAKAIVIAKSLDKLRALYDDFRETILKNPTYSAHISQAKPLVVEKGKNPNITLTDQDVRSYVEHKNIPFTINIDGKPTTIMPYNLSNVTAFQQFYAKSLNVPVADLGAPGEKDMTKALSEFLSKVINGLKE